MVSLLSERQKSELTKGYILVSIIKQKYLKIMADQASLMEQFIADKKFINTETKDDIVAQFKGKNLSVTEYSGDNIGLLLNSIKEEGYEYVILEVASSDYHLEQLNSLMQCIQKRCTNDANFITSISEKSDGSIICTCIKTCVPLMEFSKENPSPLEEDLHKLLDMMGCHTGRQLLYSHHSYHIQSLKLKQWKQYHKDADSEIMAAVDQMLSCLTAEKYHQHIKATFYNKSLNDVDQSC